MLDFYTVSNTNGQWEADAVVSWYGGVLGVNYLNRVCKTSAGRLVGNVYKVGWLIPGGAYAPVFGPAPPSTLAVASLGLRGVGGTWAGKRLPFALPGAPLCAWAIDPLLMWAYVTDASGRARVPALGIPYDKQLAGLVFYNQPLYVDARANKLGMVTGTSYRWVVGIAAAHMGWVLRSPDTKPPAKTGQVYERGRGPVVELGS